jgi:hypothetical protein
MIRVNTMAVLKYECEGCNFYICHVCRSPSPMRHTFTSSRILHLSISVSVTSNNSESLLTTSPYNNVDPSGSVNGGHVTAVSSPCAPASSRLQLQYNPSKSLIYNWGGSGAMLVRVFTGFGNHRLTTPSFWYRRNHALCAPSSAEATRNLLRSARMVKRK